MSSQDWWMIAAQKLAAIEPPEGLDRCVARFEKCNDDMPCPQHYVYKPIRQRLKDFLNTTTLIDLAASLRAKPSEGTILFAQSSSPAP